MAREKCAEVHLRMTQSEKENLIARAAESRLSLSKYLLMLSEQKKIVVIDDVPELVRQIVKIGTNVNQVALVANTHKSVSLQQIESLNDNLIEIQRLLGKLIDTIKNTDDEIKV